MANAGRVAIVPKGEYSDTVDYKRLDLVRFDNDLYIAKKANTGVAPTDSETWMLALENVSQTQYDDLINGTTPVGNAKDSDTVDNLHATDFMRAMTPGRMREMGFDSEKELYVSIDGTMYSIPFSMSRYDVITTSGGTINGLLKLDNGSGDYGGYLRLAKPELGTDLLADVNLDVFQNSLQFREEGGNFRGAYLDFTKCANSSGSELLHTGNSQKVVTSASAPSDTSALWYDIINKILKRYVDGAWQA